MSERTSPTQQAEDFCNAIRYKQYDIIPVLDIETNSWGRSNFEITNRCLEFINRFKELSGQNVMIYTYYFFGLTELDFRIKSMPTWMAHYGAPNPLTQGFTNIVAHEYSQDGRVLGISGDVDMNNFTEGILLSNSNYVPQITTVVNDNSSDINIYSQLQAELNRQGFGDLDIDGIPGELTLNACPLVRKGARGNITQWIQLRVGANPDGIFGKDTKQAVKWFQDSRGIAADGIVGENTWHELLNM